MQKQNPSCCYHEVFLKKRSGARLTYEFSVTVGFQSNTRWVDSANSHQFLEFSLKRAELNLYLVNGAVDLKEGDMLGGELQLNAVKRVHRSEVTEEKKFDPKVETTASLTPSVKVETNGDESLKKGVYSTETETNCVDVQGNLSDRNNPYWVFSSDDDHLHGKLTSVSLCTVKTKEKCKFTYRSCFTIRPIDIDISCTPSSWINSLPFKGLRTQKTKDRIMEAIHKADETHELQESLGWMDINYIDELFEEINEKSKEIQSTPSISFNDALELWEISPSGLEGVNLSGENLSNAMLRNANLRGAVLYETDCRCISLQGASLVEANLVNADFQGSNCAAANFQGADLEAANFQDSNLRATNLQDANFNGADLTGSNLSGADLRRANLELAKLRGADIRNGDLRGAKFLFADLEDAHLKGANLQRADLTKAMLQRANLENAKLGGAILVFADLQWANLIAADLREAMLQSANFGRANLWRAKLQSADLFGACLKEADLEAVNFRGAILRAADLREASLVGADLREAILIEADFRDADLLESNLLGAKFEGSNFRGANLQGALADEAFAKKMELEFERTEIKGVVRIGLSPQTELVNA